MTVLGVLVLTLQLAPGPNSLAREKAVLEAVIAHTIQPIAARRQRSEDAPPPLVLLRDHTLGVCDVWLSVGCFEARFALQHFDGRTTPGRTPHVGRDLSAAVRAELIESFRRANHGTRQLLWQDSPVAELLSEAREADLRRRVGLSLEVAALSAPGYSSDGHALVFGTYGRGSSWLFLLKEEKGRWRVVDEIMISFS